MLTGAELLNRVKELGDCAKTDLARGCGYVVKKKTGPSRVKFPRSSGAPLEAKALSSPPVGPGVGNGGARLPSKAVFRANANLLFGTGRAPVGEGG